MLLLDRCNYRLPTLFLLFIMASLSGCISMHDSTPAHSSGVNQPELLPSEINAFVANGPAGSIAVFSQTPWGEQLEFELSNKYFAASGRDCRSLRLRKPASSTYLSEALACQVELGQWQVVRPVTQLLK